MPMLPRATFDNFLHSWRFNSSNFSMVSPTGNKLTLVEEILNILRFLQFFEICLRNSSFALESERSSSERHGRGFVRAFGEIIRLELRFNLETLLENSWKIRVSELSERK